MTSVLTFRHISKYWHKMGKLKQTVPYIVWKIIEIIDLILNTHSTEMSETIIQFFSWALNYGTAGSLRIYGNEIKNELFNACLNVSNEKQSTLYVNWDRGTKLSSQVIPYYHDLKKTNQNDQCVHFQIGKALG